MTILLRLENETYYTSNKDSIFLIRCDKVIYLTLIFSQMQLENKIGTKGTKSGVEERAYRLPTNDMLAREQHDW